MSSELQNRTLGSYRTLLPGQAQKPDVISRVVRSMVHDYNNMLMGAVGCIDLARSMLEPSHAGYRFLEQARRTLANGAALTHQLMTFVRQPECRLGNVELDVVIERFKEILRRLLGANIEMRIHLAAPGVRVSCSEGILEEILMNLVATACDGTAPGGKLSIESEVVMPGALVRLRVSRSGFGDKEAGESNGSELRPLPASESRGIGRRLPSVCSIVSQSDGHLQVSTEKEAEVALAVYLPVAQLSQEASAAATSSLGLPCVRRSVIIVEDDAAARLSHRRALEQLGYQVVEASDGKAALSLCREPCSSIDLLLIDLAQPGTSKRQFADEVVATLPEITVLYMSTEPAEALLRLGWLKPGMVSLQKPFTAQALQAALFLTQSAQACL